MKTLIYELFSGVGFCNQLFSLETAIYLANISRRKLVLLIKNPLCHCGKPDWNYGYLLNFFTNDFLQYLPNGFDVYYKNTPKDILDIINNSDKTKKLVYSARFSNLVFVDKDLDTKENENKIKDYCHYRKKEFLRFDEFNDFEYFFIYQSNASRCFYNFYTSQNNYELMYNICKSLKFKPLFYEIAENIHSNLINTKNSYNIFLHMRFGDNHKDKEFITRYNKNMINQLSAFLDGNKTNIITPTIYALTDNKNNTDFFKAMEKYKFNYIENITKDCIQSYLNNNNMLFFDYNKTEKYEVVNAIIEMLLCTKGDDFIGTVSSTFSHYIQYLRYNNNKSFYNYSNLSNTNVAYCKLLPLNNNSCEWIKYKFSGGHPISWHYFWDLKLQKHQTLMTIEGKTDGFGSQLQACFSLIAYCKYKGYTYIHTPMYKMHHNEENKTDFPTYMNDFINIESKYRSVGQLTNYESSILHKTKEGPFVHGSLQPEYFYDDSFLKEIREIYFSKPKPIIDYYSIDVKNIALHIRRGDVNPQKYPSRFVSNQVYINLLKKIDKKDISNSVIHIFSEGKSDDFLDISNSFPDNKFMFHLNENIQSTFHALVMADILVVSKSSFAYCAALLNKNTIIANIITSWWHKPLKQWKKI